VGGGGVEEPPCGREDEGGVSEPVSPPRGGGAKLLSPNGPMCLKILRAVRLGPVGKTERVPREDIPWKKSVALIDTESIAVCLRGRGTLNQNAHTDKKTNVSRKGNNFGKTHYRLGA